MIRVNEHSPHTLTFVWRDEFGPDLEVTCNYAPDDPARPCRMFHDAESEDPRKPIDGCGVEHWLMEAGLEGVRVEGEITVDVPVQMRWDEGPVLSQLTEDCEIALKSAEWDDDPPPVSLTPDPAMLDIDTRSS
jgi:hypothetical protein